jgi:hypothetical protein
MAILLATICNMRPPRPTGLVEINLGTGSRRTIALGLAEPVSTCTGLAADERYIYVLSETESQRTCLSVLRRAGYGVEFVQALPEVKDGHSIAVSGNLLYVVSTRSDEVLAYALQERAAVPRGVAWRASDARRDTHHLNAVAVIDDALMISGFGEKTGQTWSSAVNGYLLNASSGQFAAQAVYQPHSLCAADGEVHFCESARGSIATLSGRQWHIGGYLRGLASLAPGRMAVGFNVTRKVSKSTGIENNPDDPGAGGGECGIGVYDLSAGEPRLLAEFDMSEHGNEIYDLLCLAPLDETAEALMKALPPASPRFASPRDLQQENLQLHVQLTEFAHTLSRMRNELDAAQLELASREQALCEARRAMLEMLQSKSWRLTAPLRQFRQWWQILKG